MICVSVGLGDNQFIDDVTDMCICLADAMFDEVSAKADEKVQRLCKQWYDRETTYITYHNGDMSYGLWQPGIGLINPRLLLELMQKQKWFLERGPRDFWPFWQDVKMLATNLMVE